MTYKSLIVTIVVFLALGAGIGFFLFRSTPTTTKDTPEATQPDDFFPVSKEAPEPARRSTTSTTTPVNDSSSAIEGGTVSNTESTPRPLSLRQLVARPSTGAFVFARGKATVVRYVEKETGHVSEIATDEKVPTKVTNTTLPKSFQVWWGPQGESLVLQLFADKINTVQTIFANIVVAPAASSSTQTQKNTVSYVPSYRTQVGTLEGATLPTSIQAITLSPDHRRAFYLLDANGGTLGIISDVIQSAATRGQLPVFQSSFQEWLPEWSSADTITLTTRASAGVPGYAYFLHPSTKQFEKVLAGIPGLTSRADPRATVLLYSKSDRTGLALYLYDLATHTKTAFPIQTLPEKCVFSTKEAIVYCAVPEAIPAASYPDAWYQGVVQFTDNLWRVDLESGESQLLVQPTKIRRDQEIDAIDLMLAPDERALVFRNKRDNSVWMLAL